MIKYRPEVDGLRTIAVLAVIIYHAQFEFGEGKLLTGGFLGVDIFFVISGFLITSLMMNEFQKTGWISIPEFYERRARRILPALLFVMMVAMPFAWTYLLPEQLKDYSYSLIFSLLFGSNFYWNYSLQQYGAESALLKPFLHTWSLAVEEQFYIIFPLILLAVYRWFKRHTIVILTAGMLLSLQFAEWMTQQDTSFSFYMLPSRFWELLAGGLLANILHLHPQKDNDDLLKRTMPVLGLFLIFHSVAFTDFDTNHPGFATLVPVIGTILIIWFASENELVTKLLSSRLFVATGLISYSLYLWHYPIFAFGRTIISKPSSQDKLLWILLTFILSVVTYFLIEKPFRNRKAIPRKNLIVILLLAATAVSVVSIYWIKVEGDDSRLGYLREVLEPTQRVWVKKDGTRCHSNGVKDKLAFDVSKSCVFEYYPDGKYLIVIGDSHAGSLAEKARELAENNGLNFMQISRAGCAHIKGMQLGAQGACQKRSEDLLAFLSKFPESKIIYSARIPLYLELEKFDNKEGDQEDDYKPVNDQIVAKIKPKRSKEIVSTLESWVSHGHDLVIVYPVPEQGFHVSKKLFAQRPIITDESQLPNFSTSYEVFKKRVASSYKALDLVNGGQVFRIYPEKLFCRDELQRCFVSEGRRIYFGGDNHVSPLGSSLIMTEVARVLKLNVPEGF